MQQAWRDDVERFFAAVEKDVQARLRPLPLGTDGAKKRFRYWWIGDDAMPGHAGLWMDNLTAAVIHQNRLVMLVGVDEPVKDQVRRVRALAERSELRGKCHVIDKDSWNILGVELELDASDPAGSAAEQVSSLLRVIHEAAPPVAKAVATPRMTPARSGSLPKPTRRRG